MDEKWLILPGSAIPWSKNGTLSVYGRFAATMFGGQKSQDYVAIHGPGNHEVAEKHHPGGK